MTTQIVRIGIVAALLLGACAGEENDPITTDGPPADATPPTTDTKMDAVKPPPALCQTPSWATCPDPTDTVVGTSRTMTQVSFGMPYECADGSGRHCVKCATAVTTSTVGTSTNSTEFVPLVGCVLKDATIRDDSMTPTAFYDGPFYCTTGSATAPGSTCN